MERWSNHALLSLFQFWKEAVGPFNHETWPNGAAVPNGFDENDVVETVFHRMTASGAFASFEHPPTYESLLTQIKIVTRY